MKWDTKKHSNHCKEGRKGETERWEGTNRKQIKRQKQNQHLPIIALKVITVQVTLKLIFHLVLAMTLGRLDSSPSLDKWRNWGSKRYTPHLRAHSLYVVEMTFERRSGWPYALHLAGLNPQAWQAGTTGTWWKLCFGKMILVTLSATVPVFSESIRVRWARERLVWRLKDKSGIRRAPVFYKGAPDFLILSSLRNWDTLAKIYFGLHGSFSCCSSSWMNLTSTDGRGSHKA